MTVLLSGAEDRSQLAAADQQQLQSEKNPKESSVGTTATKSRISRTSFNRYLDDLVVGTISNAVKDLFSWTAGENSTTEEDIANEGGGNEEEEHVLVFDDLNDIRDEEEEEEEESKRKQPS